MAATTSTEAWRSFPRYMIAAMLFVVAVNVRFVWIAVSTFPGAASSDDFDTSNNYNSILSAVAVQNALGWSERAGNQGRAPLVDITGRDQKPLAGAQVTAVAERPVGVFKPVAMTFSEASPGHYIGTQALPMPGQWDIKLRIAQGGHTARVTRRIVVK